uniref:ShKT domain-containing protein n=1 Tax=Panagrellus redivivus TaxID=6233 RepID=A0A7E4UWE9_PANRE
MVIRIPIVFIVVAVMAALSGANFAGSSDPLHPTNSYRKALVFVVEATPQNSVAVKLLPETLTRVLKIIDSDWFDQFVVIGFDSSGINFSQSCFTASEAIKLLQSLAEFILPDYSSCDMPVLQASLVGIGFSPQSVMYLITTAGSSVSDQAYELSFLNSMTLWDVQLQSILINSAECNNSLSSQNTYFVANLAVVTGGDFVELSNPSQIDDYICAHLPTLYDSALVETPTHGTFLCAETSYYAAVEDNVGTVYLYSYSDSAVPSVQSGYNSVSLTTLFDDGHARIFSFAPVDGPGIYTIDLNDVGPCSLQIRSQAEIARPTVATTLEIQLTTSFVTTASQTTGTTPQPTTSVPQILPCIDKIDCTPNAGECGLAAFKPLLYNYCRKTCGFCNECIDADDRCKYWVPNHFCTNAFYANITDECAKSCNKCTG